MFADWRRAADRVEDALAAHEHAAGADGRPARGAQGGFVHRWADLARHSDRVLNFARLGGGDDPQALAVLARGWSPRVPPRLPRDAAHIRHFIAEARLEVERLAGPAPAPVRAKRPGYPARLLAYMEGRESARFDEIAAALGCDPGGIPMLKVRANQALRLRGDPRELAQDGTTIRWRAVDPGASNNTNK